MAAVDFNIFWAKREAGSRPPSRWYDVAMQWTEDNGWFYEMLPLDVSSDVLDRFSELRAFRDLWISKRCDTNIPGWRDFEIEDFAPWYGWLVVDDILDGDVFDTRIRLWGTNVTRLWGQDLTGKLSRDFEGIIFAAEDFEMYATMVREKQYRVCIGPLDWKHDFTHDPASRLATIQLPLADDGETIDRLIELYVMVA